MWFILLSPPSLPSPSLPSLASHSSQGMSLNSRGGGYSNGTHSPPYPQGYDGNGGGAFEAGRGNSSSASSNGSGSYSPTHSGSPTENGPTNGYSQVHLTTYIHTCDCWGVVIPKIRSFNKWIVPKPLCIMHSISSCEVFYCSPRHSRPHPVSASLVRKCDFWCS